jgi:uncharacterized protein (TIGR02231 family)
MKRILALAALAVLTIHSFAQDAKRIKPRITDVTVFLSGAQITQKGEVNLKAGENKIIVTDITSAIDPNSIQLQGNPDYTILSVRNQTNYLQEGLLSPEAQSLTDSLDEVRATQEEQQVMRNVYNEEINFMRSNQNIKGQDDPLLPEDLAEMSAYYRTRMKELQYKMLELQQADRLLNAKALRLQQRLSQLNARRETNPSEIAITLNAVRDGKSTIQISYFVNNAGWTPVYDLRAEDINSKIEFAYRAQVHQSTGTDWEKVKLTISTGNPVIGGEAPILDPWYLSIYQPVLQYVTVEDKSEAANYAYEMAAPQATWDSNTSVGFASGAEGATYQLSSAVNTYNWAPTISSGVNATFTIDVNYDIPSDGQMYDVVMQKQQFTARYGYVTVPKLSSDVFLRAQVTDWAQYALLPGESNVYFKGTFVGKGFIDPALANDTLNLSLGRDNAISVKRDQVKDFCKSSLFGGKKNTSKVYDISVTNNKKVGIDIEVLDQVPVSQDGEISVDIESVDGGALDMASGKVSWKTNIAPGGNFKKQLKFNVSYPKNKLINNL